MYITCIMYTMYTVTCGFWDMYIVHPMYNTVYLVYRDLYNRRRGMYIVHCTPHVHMRRMVNAGNGINGNEGAWTPCFHMSTIRILVISEDYILTWLQTAVHLAPSR